MTEAAFVVVGALISLTGTIGVTWWTQSQQSRREDREAVRTNLYAVQDACQRLYVALIEVVLIPAKYQTNEPAVLYKAFSELQVAVSRAGDRPLWDAFVECQQIWANPDGDDSPPDEEETQRRLHALIRGPMSEMEKRTRRLLHLPGMNIQLSPLEHNVFHPAPSHWEHNVDPTTPQTMN